MLALAGAAPAGAAPAGRRLAPGVTYRHFDLDAAAGKARAHLLTVDLADPHVHVDLLYPGAVAARATVSRLADAAGAVAGVNGDFFTSARHSTRAWRATGAAVGPAVADGEMLKAAVPKGQRFGPALPPGTGTQDVLGVGTDRRARLDRLSLSGSVATPEGKLSLKGPNQYALPVDSVGAFTAHWGRASRVRGRLRHRHPAVGAVQRRHLRAEGARRPGGLRLRRPRAAARSRRTPRPCWAARTARESCASCPSATRWTSRTP
ncbi:hypothetical protein LT493_02365 [Streptomyces tricolor]|nr:hypothetical protein [Streptomyces tricolor]